VIDLCPSTGGILGSFCKIAYCERLNSRGMNDPFSVLRPTGGWPPRIHREAAIVQSDRHDLAAEARRAAFAA